MHFQPVPVGVGPCPNVRILVVGGVVLNQDRPLPAVSPRQLLEEAEIGDAVEDRVLAVVEACSPQFDGTEDLYMLALPGDGNLRWIPYAAPGGVERRV